MRFYKTFSRLLMTFILMTGCTGIVHAEEEITGSGLSADDISEMNEMVSTDAASAYMPVTVSYRQAEARSMLTTINAFRTGNDAWAWNESNTEKVWYKNLKPLTYDYELERVAMQRAAELVLSFTHYRPDGSLCRTAYPDTFGYGWWGENIAAGFKTADITFNVWKEDDEDYYGQGHRRNMLADEAVAIGIGCAVYNGSRYWVQEFAYKTLDTKAVNYDENSRDVSVPITESSGQLSVNFTDSAYQKDPNVSLEESQTITLPAVKAQFYYRGSLYRDLGTVSDIRVSDSSVIRIENGILKAVNAGNARVVWHAQFGSYSKTVQLNVSVTEHEHTWAISSWKWAEDHTSASAVFTCTKEVSHQKSVTAKVTKEITDPLCYKEGKTVYTASVQFEGKTYTDQQSVPIPATGAHDYAAPAYTWSADYTEVTAKAVCKAGGEELIETAGAIYEVIEMPTAEKEGTGRFTAVFTNSVFKTQTRDIRIPYITLGSPSSVSLSLHETKIVYNKTAQLSAAVSPKPSDTHQLIWMSMDSSVATVDQSGRVKGIGPGLAEIRAMTLNGVYDSCMVRVLFTDASDSSRYFYDPVYWALDRNITIGAGGAGKFSPYAPCTREQIVTFLWRMEGEPKPKGTSSFTDVKTDDWFYQAVTWAAEQGITVGLNDGTGRFGVGQPCTREQCVTFLHRAAGKPAVGTHQVFTDVASDRYYYDSISWAASGNITVGLNDGTGRFGVGETCTRAMIVTFLYRYAASE